MDKFVIFEVNKLTSKFRKIDVFDDYEMASDLCESLNNFSCSFPVRYCVRCLCDLEYSNIENYSPFFFGFTLTMS